MSPHEVRENELDLCKSCITECCASPRRGRTKRLKCINPHIGTWIAWAIPPMSAHRRTRDRIEITRFQLQVVRGPDSPHRVVSTGSELTIGSDPGHPLRLTDPCVSRQHCVLGVSDEGVVCTDLGSTNGTLIAGRRITSA